MGLVEVGSLKMGLDEVGFLKMGLVEVGSLKMGLAEVGFLKMGLAEVGFFQVWLYILMLSSPLVPCLHTLFEDVKMFLVCHRLSSSQRCHLVGLGSSIEVYPNIDRLARPA